MSFARLAAGPLLFALCGVALTGCGSGNNPVHTAAQFGGPEELAAAIRQPGALINGENRTHNTPLHEAVIHDNEPAVKWLIAHGANVKAGDEDGDTPIHFAAERGFNDCIVDLINLGHVDVNIFNHAHQTPLFTAASNVQAGTCTLLCEHGANVNMRDKDGDTPLHEAATASISDEQRAKMDTDEDPAVETIKVLLAHGANPDLRNHEGLTPRAKALANGNYVAARALGHHVAKD